MVKNPKLKILRVIASMDPSHGGPCQGIRNSIPELQKKGISNEVLCLDDPLSDFIDKDCFPVHALGPAQGPWCYSLNLIPWLLNNFHRFDIIILHGLWLYPNYAVWRALNIFHKTGSNSKGNQKKLYVMPHGMLDPYFQKVKGRWLKAIRNWFYWKLIEGKVVNSADGVLFTCEKELRLARQPFSPYKPKREINIGYGIAAPPSFTPNLFDSFLQKCPQLHERNYLLFLGRIDQKKGVDLILEAYATIIKKNKRIEGEKKITGPEIPSLVIAGPGMDTPYGKKIKNLVEKLKIPKKHVFFPGMLSGDAKWGAFYGCEAFLLPSHQENFGISVVEALACSKPVLISNQINICAEISKGGCGLVDKDTKKGTLKLFSSWQKMSPQKKYEMGTRARELYQTHFSIDRNVNRLIEALNIS